MQKEKKEEVKAEVENVAEAKEEDLENLTE